MTFSWKNEGGGDGVTDRVIACRVNDQKIGRLHYYEGVGYFAYFLEQRLNSSPIGLKEAMNLVQDAYVEWVESRKQTA